MEEFNSNKGGVIMESVETRINLLLIPIIIEKDKGPRIRRNPLLGIIQNRDIGKPESRSE